MAFNYFYNSSTIGLYRQSNTEGINSLDSKRINKEVSGGHTFNTSGAHTWTAPAGVTSISVVCIGGGGGGIYYNPSNQNYSYAMNGGSGAGLAWVNTIPVTPTSNYYVNVGAAGISGIYSTGSTAGGDSYFVDVATCKGGGGGFGRYSQDRAGGTYTASSSYGTYGGGLGGAVDFYNSSQYGPAGGGGAGGYSGAGGQGGQYNRPPNPGAGSGGGGGGGGYGVNARTTGGGGGTGIYGEGSNGTAGGSGTSAGGGGGSGGTDGGDGNAASVTRAGGTYGGGGGGASSSYWNGGSGVNTTIAQGGIGVVRIIWGIGRAFPATGDLSAINESVN